MSAPIRITVSTPDPDSHLFEVEMVVPMADREEAGDTLDLQLPVWTPGSYLVREYARHVRRLEAEDADGGRLPVRKVDKTTWRVDTSGSEAADVKNDTITARYTVYAHTLNVREKHLDDSHGFFQPTALLMHPADGLDRPVTLTVEPPEPEWTVYCPLEPLESADENAENSWQAPNFDVLYDAPVEMGDHQELHFEASGADHTMVFWGEGNFDRERLAEDIPKIVEANGEMFGGVPYEHYLFITLLSDRAYGGLEHRNSTSLIYPQHAFGEADADDAPPFDDDDYLNFLSLVSHEHFHTWNVKRIRPEALQDFDYENENYLRELWTVEGVTSYYDQFGLLRAGLIDADKYLEFVAKGIRRLERTPGRHVQSLEQSSWDAWIKFYRRDENTPNATVSYYLKGSQVAMLLDLRIRRGSDGEHSLDDLMSELWTRWEDAPERGYAPGTHEELASELAGTDLTEFFDRYIRGTDEIDWETELGALGLELRRERDDDTPEAWLGINVDNGDATSDGRIHVGSVPDDTPAAAAGLYPGDQLVAFDGWSVTEESDLKERLTEAEAGRSVELHLFRRGRLLARRVELGEHPADDYSIVLAEEADDRQRRLLKGWLGTADIETAESASDTDDDV